MRPPCILLLAPAAAALLAAGCGYAGIAAAAFLGGGGGGGGGGGSNSEPVAQVVAVPRGDETTQPIHIRISDKEGNPVGVKLGIANPAVVPVLAAATSAGTDDVAPAVEGEEPAEPGFDDATIVGFQSLDGTPATEPLATSPGGTDYLLLWAWPDNLGPGARLAVDLRLSLLDENGKEVGTPVLFTAEKVGNDPPKIRDVEIEGAGGVVVVHYRLCDSTFDDCDIAAKFRVVGEDDKAITARVGGDVTKLGTTPEPEPNDFTWRSEDERDLDGKELEVVVTLMATDEAGAESDPASSPETTIDNNAPTEIQVLTLTGRFADGTATVRFRLFDEEGDDADVDVFSFPPGDTDSSDDLLALAAPGSGSTGLETAPDGGPELEFDWSYEDQVGSEGQPFRLRLIPNDAGLVGDAGTAFETGTFDVGNDAPDVGVADLDLTAVPPPHGNVPIPFTIEDSQGDSASVVVQYFNPSLGMFIEAKPGAGTVTEGLATAPGAPFPPHTFVWDSEAAPDEDAMAGLDDFEGDVLMRMAADDGLDGGGGGFVEFMVEGLDNVANFVPVVTIDPPVRDEDDAHVTGIQPIHFTITDEDAGDTHTVAVKFFFPEDAASPTGDATGTFSSPTLSAGSHTFFWDYGAPPGGGDLGDTKGRIVRVEIVATDSQTDVSVAAVTEAFIVGNDPPEIVGGTITTADEDPSAPGIQTSGTAVFDFTLQDTTADLSRVTLEFQAELPGDPTLPITEIVGGVLPGDCDPFGSGSLLVTSAGGVDYDFTWKTKAEVALGSRDTEVTVFVTPCDEFGPGVAAELTFTLLNNEAPTANILAFGSDVDRHFELAIDYFVSDPDSPRLDDVVIQWRRLGGGPFPSLDALDDPDEREAILADPVERRALQIMTEKPKTIEGRVTAGATANEFLAPEAIAAALPVPLPGQTLEILRDTLAMSSSSFTPPSPITAVGSDRVAQSVLVAHAGAGGKLLRLHDNGTTTLHAEGLGMPAGIAVSQDGRAALVTDASGDGRLLKVALDGPLPDPAPDVLASSGLPNAAGVAFAGTTGAIVAVDLGSPGGTDGEVRFVSIQGGTPVTVFGGLAAPRGLARFASGEEVLIVESGSGRLLKTSLRPGAVRGVVSAGLGTPLDIALEPDGRSVLVTSSLGSGSLRRIHLRRPDDPPTPSSAENAVQVKGGLGALVGLGLSPDGKLAVARDAAGILEVHLPGEVVQRRTITGTILNRRIFVNPGLAPIPTPGTPFRIVIQSSSRVAAQGGHERRFIWDSFGDLGAIGAGGILGRIVAFGPRRGAFGLGGSPKLLRSGLLSPSAQTAFSKPSYCGTTSPGRGVAVGDMDGDGYADVVVSLECGLSCPGDPNCSDGQLRYFRQDPLLGQLDPVAVTIDGDADPDHRQIALGDVNGDGRTDVIAEEEVFLQDSLGGFAPGPTLDLPGSSSAIRAVAAGDVNGDGLTDVIAADLDTNVGVFVQSGGALGTPGVFPNRLPSYGLDVEIDQSAPGEMFHFVTGLTIGDANGDGLLDALAATGKASGGFGGSVKVFLQDPLELKLGNLPPTPTDPRTPDATLGTDAIIAVGIGDVNHDRRPDAIAATFSGDVGGTFAIYHGNAMGKLGQPTGPSSSDPRAPSLTIPVTFVEESIVVQDVNGDGLTDVGTADEFAERFIVFLQDGSGGFVADFADVSLARFAASGDLDGDGRGDVAVLGSDGTLTVLLEEAPGTVAEETTSDVTSLPGFSATGDLTGDGRVDVALGNFAGPFTLVEQVPGATLVEQDPVTGPPSPFLAIADVSGDSRLDLLGSLGGEAEGNLGVFHQEDEGLGPLTLVEASGGSPVKPVRRTAAGDVDGDGLIDVVAAGDDSSQVIRVLLQGLGGLELTPPGLLLELEPKAENAAVAIEDVNDDGREDVIASGPENDSVYVFFQNGGELGNPNPTPGGPRIASRRLLPGSGAEPGAVAVGDVNGNALPDVVIGNHAAGTASVFLQAGGELGTSAGAGLRDPSFDLVTSTDPVAIVVGDVNGDGRGDVVVGCSDDFGQVVDIFLQDALADLGLPIPASTDRAPNLVLPIETIDEEFFLSLSLDDLNGDGRPDLVVNRFLGPVLRIRYGR